MKIIKKKVWPEYFKKIQSGEKGFEVRLADFNIENGDILLLEEYDPKTKTYTGRSLQKKVNYIAKTKGMEEFHTKEDINKHGFYILQMEDPN